MDINMIINTIIETAPLWGTALVSIVGVIVTVMQAINKAKDAIEDMRADNTLKEVKKELEAALQQNQTLIATQNALLDRMTHIENYMEKKKK